jgi:DNA modification methylase
MLEVNQIYQGDALEVLKTFPDKAINCCVTSPPYYGLRDYGVDGQIGLEETPKQYIDKLTAVFREVRRVLRDDGTLWLNIGDSYAGSGKGGQSDSKRSENWQPEYANKGKTYGLKPKDLIGIPWMLAFALRADGWHLRQDIIWAKPNPMPESVTDRCTKSHEYIFLLSKSQRYYYDHEAIAESVAESTTERMAQDIESQKGSDRVPGKANGTMKAVLPRYGGNKYTADPDVFCRTKSGNAYEFRPTRNKRDIWVVTTKPFKEAHFATFPPDLIEPCILAGCPKDGIVLDPFMGSGTTGMVAKWTGRNYVCIELNPQYIDLAEKRINEPRLPTEKPLEGQTSLFEGAVTWQSQ